MSRYALPNADQAARDRLTALERVFDPGTFEVLAKAGVAPGMRCLEVGAGAGSVAAWLAERVGPADGTRPGGSVLATDLDPRFLLPLAEAHPNLTALRHDIVADPLPEAASDRPSTFDLVHARLVLEHLPGRDAALAKLVAALAPGGRIVLEAIDFSSEAPDPDASPEVAAAFATLHGSRTRLLADAGFDHAYARTLGRRLRAAGLADVAAEGRSATWFGGPDADTLWHHSVRQLRPRLVAGGYLTDADADAIEAMLADPAFSATSPIVVAAVGTRPA